jgi:hypothetical protein
MPLHPIDNLNVMNLRVFRNTLTQPPNIPTREAGLVGQQWTLMK